MTAINIYLKTLSLSILLLSLIEFSRKNEINSKHILWRTRFWDTLYMYIKCSSISVKTIIEETRFCMMMSINSLGGMTLIKGLSHLSDSLVIRHYLTDAISNAMFNVICH